MRLLFIAYELDPQSQVLAWQYRLAEEFAKRCDFVLGVAQKIGRAPDQPNLRFRPLPVWLRRWPVRFTVGFPYQNWLLWSWMRECDLDCCLMHMHHKAAYRFWPALTARGLPRVLWYAHGSVSFSLRVAHHAVDRVISSTPEGFRLPSRKAEFIGQCVDTELFRPTGDAASRTEVITVGRVSRRKQLDLALRAFSALCRAEPAQPLRFRIVGAPITIDDTRYAAELRALAADLGIADLVVWDGHRTQAEIAARHAAAFVHLNVSQTGSMDKTAMEALACDCPVVTSNEALLPELSGIGHTRIDDDNPTAIGHLLLHWFHAQASRSPGQFRQRVLGRHDMRGYVDRVLHTLETVRMRQGRAPLQS